MDRDHRPRRTEFLVRKVCDNRQRSYDPPIERAFELPPNGTGQWMVVGKNRNGRCILDEGRTREDAEKVAAKFRELGVWDRVMVELSQEPNDVHQRRKQHGVS